MKRKTGKRGRGKKRAQPQVAAVEPVAADVLEMYGLEAVVRLRTSQGDQADHSTADTSEIQTPRKVRALLRKSIARRPGVVVGDCVMIQPVEHGPQEEEDAPGAVIVAVTPRRNTLLRPDFHGRAQAVVANMDYVVVVVTPDQPPLRLGLIDRYLAASFRAQIQPLICLHKSDLDTVEEAKKRLACYAELDIPMVCTSVQPQLDVTELRTVLTGKRSVLVGHSGVGKSSLACALIPGLDRRVGDLNEVIGRGRHTTTTATLLPLPEGGELVDTPGVRSFGLFGVTPEELTHLYPEFLSLRELCKFRTCTHRHEPQCAVREALEEGNIDRGRYERYQQLYESLQQGQH